jgi:SH3 domain-containing YSC84-like protein 1
MDTLLTYHRTWETGVGYGHEGHRIQPFIIFQHLCPKLLACNYNREEELMKRSLTGVFFALLILFFSTFSFAGESAASRAESAATVLNEIMLAPDKGIPEEILGSAKCVAVVPTLIKVGFVVGGSHGRGMATCRTESGWSAPAPFHMTGGSFGFQIGAQGVDLVMMVMSDRGMQVLLSSKFKLGADASAAAGPVGRHAEGSTDWKLRAEVLTYSRARGLFAGVTVNGSSVTQDDDATRELYGRMVPFKSILTGAVPTPQGGEPFVAAVRKAVGSETSASSVPAKSNVPVNPPPTSPAPAAVPVSQPAPAAPPSGASPSDQAAPAPTPTPSPGAAEYDRESLNNLVLDLSS